MDEKDTLSQGDFDRFCIEELVLRSAGIRHALADLVKQTEQPSPDVSAEDLLEILAELQKLQHNAERLSDDLRKTFSNDESQAVAAPPLVLVNPMDQPRRYTIENIFDKLAGQKT